MDPRGSMIIARKESGKLCFCVASSARKRKSGKIQSEKPGDVVVLRCRCLLLRLNNLYGVSHAGVETVIDLGQSLSRVLPIRLCKLDLAESRTQLDQSIAYILLNFCFLIFIFRLALT